MAAPSSHPRTDAVFGVTDGAPVFGQPLVGEPKAPQPAVPPPASTDNPHANPRVSDLPQHYAKRLKERLRIEGKRGSATRMSVWLQYASYFLVTIVAAGVVHAAFQAGPGFASGGMLLLVSTTTMLTSSAVAMMAYANNRESVDELMRKFVFAYTVFPATTIALLSRVLWSVQPAGEPDRMFQLLLTGIPMLFVIDAVFPAVMLVKSLVGLRSITKESLDPEENMALWTRQDGLHR